MSIRDNFGMKKQVWVTDDEIEVLNRYREKTLDMAMPAEVLVNAAQYYADIFDGKYLMELFGYGYDNPLQCDTVTFTKMKVNKEYVIKSLRERKWRFLLGKESSVYSMSFLNNEHIMEVTEFVNDEKSLEIEMNHVWNPYIPYSYFSDLGYINTDVATKEKPFLNCKILSEEEVKKLMECKDKYKPIEKQIKAYTADITKVFLDFKKGFKK